MNFNATANAQLYSSVLKMIEQETKYIKSGACAGVFYAITNKRREVAWKLRKNREGLPEAFIDCMIKKCIKLDAMISELENK